VRVGASNTLMRLDTHNLSPVSEEIARDVNSWVRYFLVGDNSLCFERWFEGGQESEWLCVTPPQGKFRLDSFADGILRLENGATLTGLPFISFHSTGSGAADVWMRHGGFGWRFKTFDNGDGEKIISPRKSSAPLFRFKAVKYTHKHALADGFLPHRTALLPGGRYLFLSFLFGDFLVDRDSGTYRALPKATRVYVNLNSAQNPGFHRTGSPLPSFRYLLASH
jgi:hypothetical protein